MCGDDIMTQNYFKLTPILISKNEFSNTSCYKIKQTTYIK
jgi:hypothetical protein